MSDRYERLEALLASVDEGIRKELIEALECAEIATQEGLPSLYEAIRRAQTDKVDTPVELDAMHTAKLISRLEAMEKNFEELWTKIS